MCEGQAVQTEKLHAREGREQDGPSVQPRKLEVCVHSTKGQGGEGRLGLQGLSGYFRLLPGASGMHLRV